MSTALLTRPLTSPLTATLNRFNPAAVVAAITAATATANGTNIDVTLTSTVNLLTSNGGTPGVVGILYSIGVGVPPTFWQDVVADEALNHVFSIPFATIGAVPGDTVNVQPGFSTTNPAGDLMLWGSVISIVAPSTVDADAAAIIAAMTVAPTAQQQTAIDTFVKALKATTVGVGTLWSKADVIMLLAGTSETDSLMNWKNPAGAKFVKFGTPTFVATEGWAGTGAVNNYLEGPVGFSAMGQTASGDAHVSVWKNTADADTSGACSSFYGVAYSIRLGEFAGEALGFINGIAVSKNSNSDYSGLWSTFNDPALPNTALLHNNGALLASTAGTSGAVSASKPWLLTRGSNSWGSDRYAYYSVGAGHTAAVEATYHAAVHALLNAMNPVVFP